MSSITVIIILMRTPYEKLLLISNCRICYAMTDAFSEYYEQNNVLYGRNCIKILFRSSSRKSI